MKVEILGEDGPKFDKLYKLTSQVADELGVPIEIVCIRDTAKIVRMRVKCTPAVLVDGEVKCSGRIPSVQELRAYLS